MSKKEQVKALITKQECMTGEIFEMRIKAESIAAEYIKAEHIEAGAVLGGTAAVSHATTEKVFGQKFVEIK